MRRFRFWSDPDRWLWFAEGDKSIVVPTSRKTSASTADNSPDRVIWEIGLIVAIPLAIAVLVQLAFAQ